MLNWIALYLIEAWLVIGPMEAAVETGISGTPYISVSAKLPKIFAGTRLNISIIIILAVTFFIWFLFYKTTFGYEIRAMGHTLIFGMEAPKAGGINVERKTIFQYPPIFEGGYGFDGIAVALIGQNEPLGVILAGILIGALRTGATTVQLAHIPKTFPSIIEGFTVGFIALQVLIRYWIMRLVEGRKKAIQVDMGGGAK
jgi:simple sugar transport system permease protein